MPGSPTGDRPGTATKILGKHSGRAAFSDKARDLGYKLEDNALNDAFLRFKDFADQNAVVYDHQVKELIEAGDGQPPRPKEDPKTPPPTPLIPR